MAERRIPICRSDELPERGTGVRFDANYSGGDTAPKPAFVVRFNGKAHGWHNRCGHVPIELDWEHGVFFDFSGEYLICSTHGALYGPQSGMCLSGRCAGRGLTRVPVVEADGMIYGVVPEDDDKDK